VDQIGGNLRVKYVGFKQDGGKWCLRLSQESGGLCETEYCHVSVMKSILDAEFQFNCGTLSHTAQKKDILFVPKHRCHDFTTIRMYSEILFMW
jgi:hypothetical protein